MKISDTDVLETHEFAGKVQSAAEYDPSGKRYGTPHRSALAPNYVKHKA